MYMCTFLYIYIHTHIHIFFHGGYRILPLNSESVVSQAEPLQPESPKTLNPKP